VTIPPKFRSKIGTELERAPEIIVYSLLTQLYHIVEENTSEKG
jgi:hypothetical protein